MLYFSPWKTLSIWLIVGFGIICSLCRTCCLSRCWTALPSWAPKKVMTLGLDLQGGSHILLAG